MTFWKLASVLAFVSMIGMNIYWYAQEKPARAPSAQRTIPVPRALGAGRPAATRALPIPEPPAGGVGLPEGEPGMKEPADTLLEQIDMDRPPPAPPEIEEPIDTFE